MGEAPGDGLAGEAVDGFVVTGTFVVTAGRYGTGPTDQCVGARWWTAGRAW
jgi:hypothetical protein